MLIDINTYIGHWPFRNLRYNTLEGLDKLAQRYDITHMVTANINGFFYKDVQCANLELLEALKAYKGKTQFLPMALVNPTYPRWEQDAREMIQAGFCGFEMVPIYHGYSLAPELLPENYEYTHRAAKVLALAQELDVPVRICASIENIRGRSAMDHFKNISSEEYYALLSADTEAHVFVTSFSPGAADEKLRKLLKTRKNTYLDTTQYPIFYRGAREELEEILSKEQLCLGSLSPFFYLEAALLRTNYCTGFDFKQTGSNPARAFQCLR